MPIHTSSSIDFSDKLDRSAFRSFETGGRVARLTRPGSLFERVPSQSFPFVALEGVDEENHRPRLHRLRRAVPDFHQPAAQRADHTIVGPVDS